MLSIKRPALVLDYGLPVVCGEQAADHAGASLEATFFSVMRKRIVSVVGADACVCVPLTTVDTSASRVELSLIASETAARCRA